jgi:hypothetical protein
MNDQQIQKANEAVNLLDQSANVAAMPRQQHVNAQLAAQFLRELLAAEEEAASRAALTAATPQTTGPA